MMTNLLPSPSLPDHADNMVDILLFYSGGR